MRKKRKPTGFPDIKDIAKSIKLNDGFVYLPTDNKKKTKKMSRLKLKNLKKIKERPKVFVIAEKVGRHGRFGMKVPTKIVFSDKSAINIKYRKVNDRELKLINEIEHDVDFRSGYSRIAKTGLHLVE